MDPNSPLAGRALLTFRNETTAAFGLQRVVIGLDELLLCSRTMSSKREAGYLVADDFPAISFPLLEGDHTLSLLVYLQGRSLGGVDIRGYRFRVQSSHTFHVDRAKVIDLATVVYEKGGPAEPWVERPAIQYTERQGGAPVAPGPSGAAAKAP